MLDRHKFAIKTNDEQNWLSDNINLLTEEERKRYWSTFRENLETKWNCTKCLKLPREGVENDGRTADDYLLQMPWSGKLPCAKL